MYQDIHNSNNGNI